MTELEDLCIHIVDDDAAFRRSLVFLFESVGWQVATHASAEDFLSTAPTTDTIACLVLDIRMPMMSACVVINEWLEEHPHPCRKRCHTGNEIRS